MNQNYPNLIEFGPARSQLVEVKIMLGAECGFLTNLSHLQINIPIPLMTKRGFLTQNPLQPTSPLHSLQPDMKTVLFPPLAIVLTSPLPILSPSQPSSTAWIWCTLTTWSACHMGFLLFGFCMKFYVCINPSVSVAQINLIYIKFKLNMEWKGLAQNTKVDFSILLSVNSLMLNKTVKQVSLLYPTHWHVKRPNCDLEWEFCQPSHNCVSLRHFNI